MPQLKCNRSGSCRVLPNDETVAISGVDCGTGMDVEVGRLLPDGKGIGPTFGITVLVRPGPIEMAGTSMRPLRSSKRKRTR